MASSVRQLVVFACSVWDVERRRRMPRTGRRRDISSLGFVLALDVQIRRLVLRGRSFVSICFSITLIVDSVGSALGAGTHCPSESPASHVFWSAAIIGRLPGAWRADPRKVREPTNSARRRLIAGAHDNCGQRERKGRRCRGSGGGPNGGDRQLAAGTHRYASDLRRGSDQEVWFETRHRQAVTRCLVQAATARLTVL